MRCINVVLFVLLALSAIGNAAACLCPANYSPVCGSNGITYGNMCIMQCASQSQGVLIRWVHNGVC